MLKDIMYIFPTKEDLKKEYEENKLNKFFPLSTMLDCFSKENIKEVIPGVYIYKSHNMNLVFKNHFEINDYFTFGFEEGELKEGIPLRDSFGVTDNAKQVLEHYPELKEDKEREFVVSLCPVRKSEQPKEYGWRWEKWGEYIGNKNPKAQYLYDEPEIEVIYCYHIIEIL